MPGSRETRFAPDHPAGAGHFPGNPIIPGALLLDEVLDAIVGDDRASRRCEIRMVKFLSPVRPGDRIRIEWREVQDDTHFECALLDTSHIAVTGTLRLSRKPA